MQIYLPDMSFVQKTRLTQKNGVKQKQRGKNQNKDSTCILLAPTMQRKGEWMGIKGEDSHWKIETVKILIQQVGTFHSIFKTGFSTSPSLNNFTQIPYTTFRMLGEAVTLQVDSNGRRERGVERFQAVYRIFFFQIYGHTFSNLT